MNAYTLENLKSAIGSVGIRPGDGVMVHSALFALGKLEGYNFAQIPQAVVDTLHELIGSQGTIVVPTFTYHKNPLFRNRKMGELAAIIDAHPTRLKTQHTIFKVAAIGKAAPAIAAADSLSAFEPGGPFETMLELGFKLLLIGASIESATIIHVAEERARVPYRDWLDLPGEYLQDDGTRTTRPYKMAVRQTNRFPHLYLAQVEPWLVKRGVLNSCRVGGGFIKSCAFGDLVTETVRRIEQDPYILCKAP